MADLLKGQSVLYKLTAVSAAGLLVGLGLCGAGTLLPEGAMDIFFEIGSAAFLLSALAMGVSLVWWAIAGITENGRR